MKKPYEGHEIAYRRMKKAGVLVWGQKGSGTQVKSCRGETLAFLKDVLRQLWAPKSGRAIEMGCGTGPMLRWVCKKGFCGLGIDISRTAISMAKDQSKGLHIQFRQGDVCHLDTSGLGKFDLAIDGLCLHCITATKDRKRYLDNVFKILNKGGLFVLLTMCGPMDKKKFHEVCKGHKIVGKTIYAPFDAKGYGKISRFNGKPYLPSRYIEHWKDILDQVHRAGFELKLIRYNAHNRKDFCGTLTVGAIKKGL
jgi:2-polyprenyl-3-methyl-5-hydroxy-6-metoxy-1,4-benzoquinol methylase